jgi:hypothetical protein
VAWLWILLLALVAGISALLVLAPLRGPRVPLRGDEETDLDRLLRDKAQALRALKDLEYDRMAGLLTEAEFASSRAEYLERAALLNRALQALTGIDVALAADDPDNALATRPAARDEGRR